MIPTEIGVRTTFGYFSDFFGTFWGREATVSSITFTVECYISVSGLLAHR